MREGSGLLTAIDQTLDRYGASFKSKVYNAENNDLDVLMEVFGITPELKRENRQYWGRELGMCWQVLVTDLCRATRSDFRHAIRIGHDEPCDLVIGSYAIDTKYRIGSGDSGTLKKFKQYGPLLRENELEPLLLILRLDNLPAAITACRVGGWTVLQGPESFAFLEAETGVDLRTILEERAGRFGITSDR